MLKQPLERDRAESSCISVLALAATLDLPGMPRHLASSGFHLRSHLRARLMMETQVAGKYDIFTKPQAPAAKLRAEQWYQLRDIIRWIRPTEDLAHDCAGVYMCMCIQYTVCVCIYIYICKTMQYVLMSCIYVYVVNHVVSYSVIIYNVRQDSTI